MTLNIDIKVVLFVIWAVMMLISIIINVCILCALRKNTKSTFSEAVKKGFATANEIITKLNVEGITDTINLVKDIILPNKEPTAEDDEDRKN